MDLFKRFIQDESGATAVEYGLIAAVIGLATIVGGQAMGDALNSRFAMVSDSVQEAGIAAGSGW